MYKLLDNKIVYMIGDTEKGVLEFRVNGNQADIYHTYVDDDLRGQGIASKLVEMAFDYFDKNNYEVKCSCSYARNWAIKHGRKIL